MSEPNILPRKVCLADFFPNVEEINNQNKHCKNHLQNDNIMIAKNQKEFGHRKRIKP
jgi:hypothetical protein